MEFINYKKLFFDEAESDNNDSNNADNQPDASKAPANNNDQKSDKSDKDSDRNEKKYSDAMKCKTECLTKINDLGEKYNLLSNIHEILQQRDDDFLKYNIRTEELKKISDYYESQ